MRSTRSGTAFCAGGSLVRNRSLPSCGQISGTSHSAYGRVALLRAIFERARLPGRELHGVWTHHAGAGARRFGLALAGVRAGRAYDSGNPFVWLAGATGALVAATGIRRT